MEKGIYFHCYRKLDCWALVISITTMNASLQVGPFLVQLFWRVF